MHELIVVHLHDAAAVRVEALEGLGEGLDHNARAHEAVERHPGRRSAWLGAQGRAGCDIYPREGRIL